MENRKEKVKIVTDFLSWAPKSLQMVTAAMKLKIHAPRKESYDKLRQHIKEQRYHFADKGPYSLIFAVVRHGCESWTIKKAEHWSDTFELWCLALESPLDCKVIKPLNPKGNQCWIFIGRMDAKAEAPILWPPDAKSQVSGKDPVLGKTEGKRRSEQQRMRWLESITDSMYMNLNKVQEIMKDSEAWWTIVCGTAKSWTWLSNWK